ncbi:GAK system CofD-like protein [Desulfohalobiaceae bacterium Ax17]|uniref:GAK system CofD-like protein n=1 Tax=Desulfovulcanus ferrireducens TaxID=2831190 RepID=UPI00207BA509|nr:GAK system CofD-like protein [Desulfovulcanus ferrireducens]MBT8764494.1 GAK system CofD-like protein [Desulfovulcanus ferrireducens]
MKNNLSIKWSKGGLDETVEVIRPDLVKIERLQTNAPHGPKILFFSGGSALKALSQKLIQYTHNSIHIITPFDSGGSSARLRHALRMPAVGDLRNRLLALADKSVPGIPEVRALLSYRFPNNLPQKNLSMIWGDIVNGSSHLFLKVPHSIRENICDYLRIVEQNLSADFDFNRASLGNLVLAGLYLKSNRKIDRAVEEFSRLVNSRGVVRPVVNRSLHLAAELENGQKIVGQHLLTGKEVQAIQSRINDIYLVEDNTSLLPIEVQVDTKTRDLILNADLICYPMGSFYTSLIANLLPKGVGEAIGQNPCPKIFIPNTGIDPELQGINLSKQIKILLKYLRKDKSSLNISKLLNFVVMDVDTNRYAGGIRGEELSTWGIKVIRYPLVTKDSAPYLDVDRLCEIIFSIT